MSIFWKRIGKHERAAMERRHFELSTRAQLSRAEARELDELEVELGKQASELAFGSNALDLPK